jgi:8-oxo-dGTP diphosphatase
MVTIRVYGLLLNESNQLLVSDEYIRGQYFTKFPGGGMEAGEGTRQCLKREFLEEMNLEVEVGEHIYTTDFYLQSAFNPAHQILAIYYRVKALAPIAVPLRPLPFAFDEEQLKKYETTQQIETFRFIDWHLLNEHCVTLPLDKIALGLLLRQP